MVPRRVLPAEEDEEDHSVRENVHEAEHGEDDPDARPQLRACWRKARASHQVRSSPLGAGGLGRGAAGGLGRGEVGGAGVRGRGLGWGELSAAAAVPSLAESGVIPASSARHLRLATSQKATAVSVPITAPHTYARPRSTCLSRQRHAAR